MNQDDFYNQVESEAFFRRALSGYSPEEVVETGEIRKNKGSIIRFIEPLMVLEKKTVLEVGCAVGDLLFFLRSNYGCDVFGVEPSPSASEIGNSVFAVNVFQSTFIRSPFFELSESNRAKFDLIVLDDVVGWMSPGVLLPTLGALDWSLKPGGSIFIRELFSPFPYKVRNRHYPDEQIFQHRYAHGVGSFFLDTGCYSVSGSREYATGDLQAFETDRVHQLWRDSLLEKSENNFFPSVEI